MDSTGTPSPAPLRTPLYAEHVALGGRLVDFAGYELPVQYAGILEEHRAVRTAAGIFDVSHMGELLVSGPGALGFLQELLPADVSRADGSHAVYSPMCRDDGGTVDDLIVYGRGDGSFLLVVNASNAAKDFAWIRDRAAARADRPTVEDDSGRYAQIALQGPDAARIAATVPGLADAPSLGRYRHADAVLPAGAVAARPVPVLVSRTGYTGEDGFELYLPPEAAPALWRALLAAGAVPAGLGARDSLRFEAGMPLYGHELGDATSPVEAGLARFLDFRKPAFVGRAALLAQATDGPARRLVGLAPRGRAIPRAGFPVLSEGRAVGAVTSGMFAPTLGRGLAMALVENRAGTAPSAPLPDAAIVVRESPEPADLVPLPFYHRPRTT